jgi:hypothetical protein
MLTNIGKLNSGNKKRRKYLKPLPEGLPLPEGFTHEFVDCATGLTTVARFDVGDLPTDDYCWVHNGDCMVKAYYDGISAGAATSPKPCAVMESTDPGSCASLDISGAFEPTFNGTTYARCEWSRTRSTSGYEPTEVSNKSSHSIPNTAGTYLSISRITIPRQSGDFVFKVDLASLVLGSSTSFNEATMVCLDTAGAFKYICGRLDTTAGGGSKRFGGIVGAETKVSDTSTSGTIEISRVSGTVTFKYGGNTITTASDSSVIDRVELVLGATNPSGASSCTFDNMIIQGTS